jgi:hypothetical protein
MKPARSGFVLPLIIGLVLAFTVLGTAAYLQLKPKTVIQNQTIQTTPQYFFSNDECQTKTGKRCDCMLTKPDTAESNPTCEGWGPIQSPVSLNETANWKTYTNTKYKFSFKYPDNVRVLEKENELTVFLEEPTNFSVGSGIYLTFNIKSNTMNLTEENIHEESTGYKCNTEYGGKCEKSLLNGYNAIKASNYISTSEIYAYYLRRDNSIIRISLSNGGEDKPNEVADKMLSTFKFTN